MLLAVTVSCVRGGFDLGRTTLWAEDGAVFLQQAHRHGMDAFLIPVAGYLLLLPRLIAAVSTQFPLAAQAATMALGAALVQGLVAGVAYVAVRAHRASAWPALFVAATVAMVPVGFEVIRNVSNLQWFLLYGAVIGQLWTPRTRYGWWVIGALLVATTTGSPFGFVPAAFAIVRWFVQRRRATFAIAAVGLLGVAVQAWVMMQSTRKFSPGLSPRSLADSFLRRVVADGILGTRRHEPPTILANGTYIPPMPSTGIIAGVVLALLVCCLVALLIRLRGVDQAIVPTLLVVTAWATFFIPVTLTSLTGADVFDGGRYYVAPALLWVTAVVLLAAEGLQGRMRSRRFAQFPVRLIAAVLLGASAVGLVTSFHPAVTRRETIPPWPRALDDAAALCAGRSRNVPAPVVIAPQGWTATLTCGELEKRLPR